ncbi:MAG: polysaccharide deacetylase family protein [Clostridia bacterium]|nr:polysaccharide deacetylase family protein [Clostridia bacterium]
MEYKKLLTFSFDDGVLQDERVIQILNKYGLKATFNLNSRLLGTEGELIINGKRINHTKIPTERVKEIYSGHEVAAHTLTHPLLTQLSEDEVIRQVEGDRLALSEIVGYEVRGFAYPGGGVNCDTRLEKILREKTNVEYARTTIPTFKFDLQEDNRFLFNPTCALVKDKHDILGLFDDLISFDMGGIELLYIWGHTYELDINDDWEYFESICRFISGREDVYYCTNIEAFDYIKSKNI